MEMKEEDIANTECLLFCSQWEQWDIYDFFFMVPETAGDFRMFGLHYGTVAFSAKLSLVT